MGDICSLTKITGRTKAASITKDLNFLNPLHQAQATATPQTIPSHLSRQPKCFCKALLFSCPTSCLLYRRTSSAPTPCFYPQTQLPYFSQAALTAPCSKQPLGSFSPVTATLSGSINGRFLFCQRCLDTHCSEQAHVGHQLKVSTEQQQCLLSIASEQQKRKTRAVKQILFISIRAKGDFFLFVWRVLQICKLAN